MGTTDNPTPETVIAYKLSRTECGGWVFAGVTPEEVATTLRNELDNEGLSAEECESIVIEAYETTREEIDQLPEFPGW